MTADPGQPPPGYRIIPPAVNITREVLDRQLEAGWGDKPAFLSDGGDITYAGLGRQVGRLAGSLRELGIERGTPVLVRLPNCLEFIVSLLALLKLGALPVLQNSRLGRDEVAYVLEHSEAQAAVTLDPIAEPLRERSKLLERGLIVARGAKAGEWRWEDLVNSPLEEPLETVHTQADEPAFVVYTSGTTGRPKGIIHAHRWVIALGDSNWYRVPPREGDVAMATGEWSFISALGHNVIFPMRGGIQGVILEGRPSPNRVLEAIQRHRVTLLYSVSTVYRRILAIEGVEEQYDLSSLRGCSATGEPLEESTWREFKSRFGCEIWEHYGISEMQMVLGQGPRWPLRPGSIGKPMPGNQVAVMDDEGRELPPGEIGHFRIKADNPGFFLGYLKDQEKTDQVLQGGWYHTGDLAWRDQDGYFWLAGRSDDCFKSRGILISPHEIENALRRHPAVAESCVVPEPDPEIGNRIRAVVVLREGHAPNRDLGEAIRSSVRQRIAPYKVPHRIEFASGLPKSPVGKILRRALIEEP